MNATIADPPPPNLEPEPSTPEPLQGPDEQTDLRPQHRVVRAVRSPWVWAPLGAIAVVALVVGLLGGWRTAQVEELRTAAPGELVPLGPYDVELHAWSYLDGRDEELPWAIQDYETWVAIAATVTSTAERASGWDRQSLVPEGFAPPPGRVVVRLEDLTLASRLTPGLTQDVVLLIPVDNGDELPYAEGSPAPFVMIATTYDTFTLSDEMGWWDPVPVARTELPYDESVAASLEGM